MTSPLSAAKGSTLNISTSTGTTATKRPYEDYDAQTMSNEVNTTPSGSSRGSSPLPSAVSERILSDQENCSPSKRHSRVMSGNEPSPLKLLTGKRESLEGKIADKLSPPVRSPRKVSPIRRFPINVSNSVDSQRNAPERTERTPSAEDTMREPDGLKRAIKIFEDESSDFGGDDELELEAATIQVDPPTNGHSNMDIDETAAPDESMASTFSAFSAVPDLTKFANLGRTHSGRNSSVEEMSPRGHDPSPSRAPRPASMLDYTSNSANLMDFTDQLRNPQRSSLMRRGDPSPLRNSHNASSTPSRPTSALIDFDIPPMPTPRSIPSITPRELESLKSNFMSEISSLKASLSGKEAEVNSLKSAVGDAEKRVGESLEQLREEQTRYDQLALERREWENRGMEMETVLRKVKDEIVHCHREREELEQKLDESEKRREAAEMMHQEAESKMAGMRAGKDMSKSSSDKAKGASTTHEVEVAVERVARELHGLYKSKHETKVAALKKSYESRWEKRVKELETRIDELCDENEKIRVDRDANLTRLEPDNSELEQRRAQAARDSAAIRELQAEIQRLEAVMQTVQHDNEDLRSMLEKERVEKGELVQLAEEMMNMQNVVSQPSAPAQPTPQPQTQSRAMPAPKRDSISQMKSPAKTGIQSLRGSIGRGSGLKAPGAALRGPHERTRSGGLPRPGSTGVPRSGILNSIEKMGNYRGRGGVE